MLAVMEIYAALFLFFLGGISSLEYEVIRAMNSDEKVIFTSNNTKICGQYGLWSTGNTRNKVHCKCLSGKLFFSIHSERPACRDPTGRTLGNTSFRR